MPAEQPQYDVVVLGSGLTGSALAACLARNGASVLVVDDTTHPRFALGEAVSPYASTLLRLIGERYRVPEIKWLAGFGSAHERVSTHGGVDRGTGFLYHRPGETQRPREAAQFPVPAVHHTRAHLYRQDTDAFTAHAAVKYGADLRQQTRISTVEFDDAGATVVPERGDPVRTRFVVDASGPASPLVRALGLRVRRPGDGAAGPRHRTRRVYAHMIGVTPYEETVAKGLHGSPRPWSQGTLHHVFPGGQLWVIGFGNHPRATNPLCSVGLSLDPAVHPLPDGTPEEEFHAFLARHPSIAAQFAGAEPVRAWAREEAPQFAVEETVGDRWCLAGPAAAFTDDLFSRNLTDGLETVYALAWRLLDGLAEDDLAAGRFAPVGRLNRELAAFSDTLVGGAATASRQWELWNAWSRIWALGQLFAAFELDRGYAEYLGTGRDPAALTRYERQAGHGGVPEYGPLRELLTEAAGLVGSVRDGGMDPAVAAEKIFGLLAHADFVPPALGLADPEHRWARLTPRGVAATLRWARTSAPPPIGSLTRDGLRRAGRRRYAAGETGRREELKHALARRPLLGRRFRVPAPE